MKLQESLDLANEQIKRLEQRLSNKAYVENAPDKVVQDTKDQLANQQTLQQRLMRELEAIGGKAARLQT